MEVEPNEGHPPVASKIAYKYKTEELYRRIHGTNQLNGNWKKKFASRISLMSAQDRFQKLSQCRKVYSLVYLARFPF
jgi:hypothetical protein